MIEVCSGLWAGDSKDEGYGDLDTAGIGAVLCVAHDMDPARGWKHGFECMKVGLVDGPGNSLTTYHTSVLALVSLMSRHHTLVCCHTGGRSLAVAVMYAHLLSECGWDSYLAFLCERVDDSIPVPHSAHREAFDKMDWAVLRKLVST